LDESLGWPHANVYRLKQAQPAKPSVADLTNPWLFEGPATPSLDPFTSTSAMVTAWRFEAESDWPPLAQSGGWGETIWAPTTCASNGQALALPPASRGGRNAEAAAADVTIALPVPRQGRWLVTPRLLYGAKNAAGTLRLLRSGAAREEIAR